MIATVAIFNEGGPDRGDKVVRHARRSAGSLADLVRSKLMFVNFTWAKQNSSLF